jgi:hypothetical protein
MTNEELIRRLRIGVLGYGEAAANRIEELEAKLTKAVEAISNKPILATYEDHVNWKRATLAEIEGEKT